MALINQQGMYQDTPSLNPLPYVNIALQQRARKQAREEAIDKYYQKLPDTINDKGLRDQEIPIINDYKNKIFEFGLKNKEALRNPKVDNGAAKLNLEKLLREAAGVARLSQNAAKTDLEIGKIRLKKDYEWMADDEEFLAQNELHNLPVTDPNHKDIDINSVLQGRPFDLSKKIKKYADIKMSEGKPIVTDHPTDKSLQVVTNQPIFSEESKQTIYTRAVNDLHNDKNFQKELKKLSPDELSQLNDISKKTFGHYIREDFADEDIAASFIVAALAPKPTTQKVQANYTNREKDKRAYAEGEFDRRQKIRTSDSLIKIAANKPGGSGVATSGNSYDEIGGVEDLVNDKITISQGMVTDNKTNMPYTGTTPFKREYLPANVTTALAAGKISIPREVTVVVKDGKIEAIRTSNGEISRQAIENLQKKVNTEPVKGAQPVYGKPKSKPKGEFDDL